MPVFVFENNELQRKLTKRLDKIEKINAGEEEPFERDQLSPTKIEVLDLEKRGINVKEVLKTEEPVEFSETIEKNKVVEILEDDVEKRQNNIEKGQDNVETVQENVEKWQGNVEELEDKVTIDTTEEIFIEPEPEQFQLKIENNLKDELLVQSSENSPLPIQINSPRSQDIPPSVQSSYRLQQNLASRGRNDSRRSSNKSLPKTNSSNQFKMLLLRSLSGNDKDTRISAAERLKVQPGQTLQDLYKPKSSDSSPARSTDKSPTDLSPGKRRNKSKNRFSSMHRLTSIVEEKDLALAREMFKDPEMPNGESTSEQSVSKNTVTSSAPLEA